MCAEDPQRASRLSVAPLNAVMSQRSPEVSPAGQGPASAQAAVGEAAPGFGTTAGENRPEWSEQWTLWLRRGDRLFVGTLTGLALLFLTLHWGRMSDWGRRPIEIEHLPDANYRYEIDINTATWVEWSQFDGLGETLARRIVAEREQNGPFETIDDLRRVKGLGPRLLAEIRPHLTIRYAARPALAEPE